MKAIPSNRTYLGISILIILIGILCYILNTLYPFIHDDYAYCFFFDENSNIIRPTSNRISSFLEVLQSQWNHYHCVNGRLISHILIQGFAALWGKSLFNIFNTFVLIAFCLVFSQLTAKKISMWATGLAFTLLFLDLPYPGQTVFWMTGAINYLWGTTFSLLILVYLLNSPTKLKLYTIICWGLIAFLTGWMNESVSIPLAGGLFFYGILHVRSLSPMQKTIILLYCLGCAFIVFSPGTFSRVEHGGEIQASNNIITFLFTRTWNLCLYYIKHPVSLIALVLSLTCLAIKKNKWNIIFHQENLYIIIVLFSTVFLWGLNLSDERIFFFYEVISWITLIRFIRYLSLKSSYFKVGKWIACVLLLACSILGISKAYDSIYSYHQYNEQVVKQIKEAPKKAIIPLIPYTGKETPFVYVTLLSDDPSHYHNRVKAFYYHKEYIAAFPTEVCHAILSPQIQYEKLQTTDSIFQIKPISKQYLLFQTKQKDINQIKIYQIKENSEYNQLSAKQILIRKLLGSYTNEPLLKEEIEKTTINFGDNQYFFLENNDFNTIKIEYNGQESLINFKIKE